MAPFGQHDFVYIFLSDDNIPPAAAAAGRDEHELQARGRLRLTPPGALLEAASFVQVTGPVQLGDRVQDAGAAQADRRDVIDGGQLQPVLADAHFLDRPGSRAHAIADMRPFKSRPGGAGDGDQVGLRRACAG